MKRALMLGVAAVAMCCVLPANAQFLKSLENAVLGGGAQQQGMPGQPQFLGNVSLPAGTYMMSNVQTGQAFYVTVQNGGMYLSQGTTPPGYPQGGGGGIGGALGGILGQPQQQQQQPYGMPGQQTGGTGLGGMMRSGLGNFLKNELMPGQQQQPMVQPGQ
jgi:hypothetical protein